LTNDDGPLNDESSPYVKILVDAIEKYTDWDLSIVVPNQQRSWIGKAHLADKNLTATFIYPHDPESNSFLGPFHTPQQELREKYKEWVLIDGTPASCADIGINHLYKEKGPVDLVLSGPNFGKNTTAVYITSSGTIGAAMEAALAGIKSIGVSYGFDERVMDAKQVARVQEAAKITVKLVDYLYNDWNGNVDLYSINIPLIDSLKVGKTKIEYAPILENRWKSIFQEMTPRRVDSQTDIVDAASTSKVQFKWKPDFVSVHESVLKSEKEGIHNDGLTLHKGNISVTPLKAVFKDVPLTGEIELDLSTVPSITTKLAQSHISNGAVFLSIDHNSYIYPALVKAVQKHLPNLPFVDTLTNTKTFQYGEYEELDFDRLHSDDTYLVNSYIYRKALIRKHYLAHTIHSYLVKHPDSALAGAFPETFQLEVDYAEFLEDSLDEAYELRSEIEAGGKTWILKPSMSDRGQGIRIFRTIEQLQEIFDSFEEDATDDEGEECSEGNHGVITSQLRHFVVQEYQDSPLLLDQYNNKKFHFRVYVLANGSIEVFVYKRILTLFALTKYTKPVDEEGEIQMFGHLTNTCLQGEEASSKNNSVVEFADLEGLSSEQKDKIFKQICDVVGEVFKAATSVDRMNFQPLKNAFEIYGLDFIVNEDLTVKLLEINAYPDFKQTGEELKSLIYDLFDSVVERCVVPFFGGEKVSNELLVQVLDENTDGW
ncbi:putative tubulin--tyrosine ligase PBY1, partial [Cyberlindnera fabianii]